METATDDRKPGVRQIVASALFSDTDEELPQFTDHVQVKVYKCTNSIVNFKNYRLLLLLKLNVSDQPDLL